MEKRGRERRKEMEDNEKGKAGNMSQTHAKFVSPQLKSTHLSVTYIFSKHVRVPFRS